MLKMKNGKTKIVICYYIKSWRLPKTKWRKSREQTQISPQAFFPTAFFKNPWLVAMKAPHKNSTNSTP